MQESLQPPILEPTSSSLLSRLTNVFVTPGEVFDEIKVGPPQRSNWIVPLVMAMIVGVVYTLIVFSQPAVIQRMQQEQENQFQQRVASGKMTQAQADQAMEAVQKWMSPAFMKIMGCAGSVVANAGILFLTALIFWGVGRRALHGNFSYMKAVEALGLATMINVLGGIVAMLLATIYGNMMVTPGPILLVSNLDATNKVHRVLSALNVMSLWYVVVASIALAKLSGATFAKAALWAFSIWAAFALLPILVFSGK